MNFPILSSITLLPILGAIFILIFNNKTNENKNVIYVSLFTSVVTLFLTIFLWYMFHPSEYRLQRDSGLHLDEDLPPLDSGDHHPIYLDYRPLVPPGQNDDAALRRWHFERICGAWMWTMQIVLPLHQSKSTI